MLPSSDSEDVSTISPGSTSSTSSLVSPLASHPEQREPLSLVVRKTEDTPRLPKHWKKSISRNYSGEENRENSCKVKTEARTVAVKAEPLEEVPVHPRLLPCSLAPSRPLTHHKIVQPWATPTSPQWVLMQVLTSTIHFGLRVPSEG